MQLPERLTKLFARFPGGRGGGALAIAVGAGLVAGFLLVPRLPAAGTPSAEPLAIELLGRPLPLDARAGALAIDRVRSYVARRFVLELPDGKRREVYLGQLGAEIDKVRLATLVRDARDPTSAMLRTFRASGVRTGLPLPVPVTLNRDQALPALAALKDEIDRAAVDARLDLDARTVVPESNGRLLDIDGTLLALTRALETGATSARLVWRERKPKRTAKDLAGVRFDAVLGWFETRYDRSEKYAARSFNLRIAASKLDGHVLLPGETLDFNELVGPRDEANGYKVAPVIAEGEVVDGIGGGTCQISGTLHGAAFFAGLGIVERYPHTRPSAYIKLGLDATVVYPTINLRIANTFDFPIVLHEVVKNGVVRAEILGPRRTRTVTLIRRIIDAIPYEEVERPDKALPAGTRVLAQRGVAGFKVRRYRIVRDGPHAVRERWDDVYPPTTQIVRVGAGDPSKDKPNVADDVHPEYLADELLVTTQGPNESDQSEDASASTEARNDSMVESREPGRFGKAGWTEQLGMPFWKSRDSKATPAEKSPPAAKKRGPA
ncbi:MAG TPA: VanW family protein [Polyangiaceae bacterium]|nr:VanW family protein [Polyangiaceae bacterium]